MSVSVELLSEVLGKEVCWTEVLKIRPDHLRIHYDTERYLSKCEDINIYELANKCKKWARNKGYKIMSGEFDKGYKIILGDFDNEKYNFVAMMNVYISIDATDYEKIFQAETEPEAIFKATSYILELLNQKG